MHRSRFPVWVAAAAALVLTGCGAMAVYTAPAKTASVQRTDSAIKADSLFWAVFHGGDYDSIPRVIQAETAAYLADPNDAVTAAHLGWAHYWRLAESARLATVPPTITDDAILARRYFQEAVALDPSDARYLGFLASAELSEGSIHKDEKLTRHGYYRLLDAVDAWPEFNLFTAGYMMSSADAASPRFKQGLEWQWKNLEVCMGGPLDRRNPVFTPLSDASGKKRACVNSDIAPHNFEGFFLNFGDMLVKSGDWQTATQVYAMARLSPDFARWKYAPVLQSHIDHAQDNVAVFNGPAAARGAPGEKIMFASTHSCMGCHQR